MNHEELLITETMNTLAARSEPAADLTERALRTARRRRRQGKAALLATAAVTATAMTVAVPLALRHAPAQRVRPTAQLDVHKSCMPRDPEFSVPSASMVSGKTYPAEPPSRAPGHAATDFRVLATTTYSGGTVALLGSSVGYQFCVLNTAGIPVYGSSPRTDTPYAMYWTEILGTSKVHDISKLPISVLTGLNADPRSGAGGNFAAGHVPASAVRVTALQRGRVVGEFRVTGGYFTSWLPLVTAGTPLPGGGTGLGPEPQTTFRAYDAAGHLLAKIHDSP